MFVPVSNITWPATPTHITLRAHEVHVWQLALESNDAIMAREEALLSPDEQARAAAFFHPQSRTRWIRGRAGLRRLLGRVLDCPPAHLTFGYGPYGKPFLEGVRLRFNLSHSGALALVAVARDREIGIDLEGPGRGMDVLALAKRFFSVAEQQALTALAPEARLSAFLEVWTRKEAFLKAIGLGLTLDLRCFDVSVGVQAHLLAIRDNRWTVGDWHLHALHPPLPFAATLAVAGTATHLQCWTWDPPYHDNPGA